jgi:hypothetical protein
MRTNDHIDTFIMTIARATCELKTNIESSISTQERIDTLNQCIGSLLFNIDTLESIRDMLKKSV